MSNAVPYSILDEEWLARFILQRSHLRQDRSVKPDAFIPHPYPHLSVTRHLQLSESEIWQTGQNVAQEIGKVLRGRADVRAFTFRQQRLNVVAAPVTENLNHANIKGWPAEKPAQKSLAQEIAAIAGKALTPPGDPT